MKGKKLLSLALSAALLGGAALPATAAGETTDARLMAVTARVKATLNLDTEPYADFSGAPEEGILATLWNLNWEGEDRSLRITAEEDGTILSLWRYDGSEPAASYRSFAPRFPVGTWEEAKERADAFLARLGLTPRYNAEEGRLSLGDTSCRFAGELLVNGLPSGHSFSLTVRLSDGAVTRFNRDSFTQKYLNGFPSAQAKVAQQTAAEALAGLVKFKLEYVLNAEGDGAILRYLPVAGDEYYVDPASGKPVNLTELYRQMEEKGQMYPGDAGGAAAPEASARADMNASADKLSAAELAGAAKLEGVLDKEALDKAARAVSALGLGKYTLANLSYSLGTAEEKGAVTPVFARLTYSKQVGQSIWRRYVRLDARTGALQTVSSSIPFKEGDKVTLPQDRAQTAAEVFLSAQAKANFTRTALYDSSAAGEYSGIHTFQYARKENGYFYTPQTIRVGVDASDGSIASYSQDWADEVPFETPDGIVSEAAAAAAWVAACRVELRYLAVPTALDPTQPRWRPLVENGYSYLYEHRLAYAPSDRWPASGVDAKTGTVPVYEGRDQDELEPYTDLEGHWAKAMVDRLAQFGVGYSGGRFQPQKELTQFDLLCLLVSVDGMHYRPGGDYTADDIYRRAYSMGLLTAEERKDSAPVTRLELTRILVNQTGLKEAAQLTGIWATGFADEADIPADLLGSVAIAKALGMARGDGDGNFLPNVPAKRVEAAAMLYRFMER